MDKRYEIAVQNLLAIQATPMRFSRVELKWVERFFEVSLDEYVYYRPTPWGKPYEVQLDKLSHDEFNRLHRLASKIITRKRVPEMSDSDTSQTLRLDMSK